MPSNQLRTEVGKALEALLPAMVVDGGGAEIVSVDHPDVVLRLVGSCGFCPSKRLSAEALDHGLRARVPTIGELRIVFEGRQGCEEVIRTGSTISGANQTVAPLHVFGDAISVLT